MTHLAVDVPVDPGFALFTLRAAIVIWCVLGLALGAAFLLSIGTK